MSQVTIIKYAGEKVNQFYTADIYKTLLETGFGDLAGDSNINSYLRRLLPPGAIGFKTNCLTPFNPTMKPLTEALASIIIELSDHNQNDIVIWERTSRELKKAGYTLNASSFGQRCMGTDATGVDYSDSFYSSGKVDSKVTNILTRIVEHNINLPVLKDHSIAGMSSGLKNMYGAIHNPNKYHGNNCSPFAGDINNLEPIRNRHRLTIVDAFRVQYDKGPGFSADSFDFYNGLIISEDPVAVDRIALEVLSNLRKKNNKISLEADNRKVTYIEVAENLGLGTAQMDKIDLHVLIVDDAGHISEGNLF